MRLNKWKGSLKKLKTSSSLDYEHQSMRGLHVVDSKS